MPFPSQWKFPNLIFLSAPRAGSISFLSSDIRSRSTRRRPFIAYQREKAVHAFQTATSRISSSTAHHQARNQRKKKMLVAAISTKTSTSLQQASNKPPTSLQSLQIAGVQWRQCRYVPMTAGSAQTNSHDLVRTFRRGSGVRNLQHRSARTSPNSDIIICQ